MRTRISVCAWKSKRRKKILKDNTPRYNRNICILSLVMQEYAGEMTDGFRHQNAGDGATVKRTL